MKPAIEKPFPYLMAVCFWLFVSSSPTEAQRSHFVSDGWGGIGHVTDPTIRLGIAPKTLLKIVRQNAEQPEGQTPQIADLAGKLAINDNQTKAALKILGETKSAPQRLGAHLFEIADQFKILTDMATIRFGDSPDMAAVKTDARKAIESGDLTKAERLWSDPAARGEIALARLQHLEAAEHFARAAALVRSTASEDTRIEYLMREADALYRYNEAKHSFSGVGAVAKSSDAKIAAVDRYQQLVGLISRERRPLVWAMMQHNLGTALHFLATRQNASFWADSCAPGPAQFKDESQVQICVRRKRQGIQQAKTAKFEAAIVAYREALKELTRGRAPLAWATTQANLAAALLSLDSRDDGNVVLLTEAVAAYREALKEFTRERTPGTWAALQRSLAGALSALGRRKRGDAAAEEASLAAYREALKEWTREQVPALWGSTQFSLGVALAELGIGKSGTARLREAVVAYRESLKETNRANDDALFIYQTLSGLLRTIGERDEDIASLEEAVASALLFG